MRINLTNVLVDDQEKALRFYTEVLTSGRLSRLCSTTRVAT